jgi:heme oxygenase (mycobilin-producing)
VLVVTRYTVPEQAGREFYAKAKSAIKVLAAQPGYVRGRIGRATDEPLQWVIVTEWQNVGAYRRAIGTYTVRVEAVPFLALARDEPTAYEILYADNLDPEGSTAEWGTDRAADADSVGLGEAAGPEIETDL